MGLAEGVEDHDEGVGPQRLQLLLHLALLVEVLGSGRGHDHAGVANDDNVPVRPINESERHNVELSSY